MNALNSQTIIAKIFNKTEHRCVGTAFILGGE